MALTIRERRLPQLHISLDLPSCAGAANFRAAPASTSAAAAARAGELRMSDFDRVAVLGRGNGGAVYKVVHRRTSAVYALKVLHGGVGGGDHGAAAATEADVMRRAASPHVVRCHSVVAAAAAATSCPGDVALLLELVDGGSLASVAARAGAFRRRRSRRWPRRRCPGWRASTPAASSTATSSRATSSSAWTAR